MTTATMENHDSYVSCKEAAQILGISKCSVYRWRKRGWLSGVLWPNGTIRILRESVDNLLNGEDGR